LERPRIPLDEAERLAALLATNLLDTPSEVRFDRLTRIARHHFKVSTALVSLIDSDRQWFKSRQGMEASETPRDVSFCGHAILQDDVFCIPDALKDHRFADNPLVTGPPHIRFYAGAPIHATTGDRIGTLCILDGKPRQFGENDREVLMDLAACVDEEIRRSLLMEQAQALAQSQQLEQVIVKAERHFISAGKQQDFFEDLLRDVLRLTDSHYGFIAEVVRDSEGSRQLKPCAREVLTPDPTKKPRAGKKLVPGPDFESLAALSAPALQSGLPVLLNAGQRATKQRPAAASQSVPHSFLAIPIHTGDKLVAILGMADRPSGYSESLVEFLTPITVTVGQLLDAARVREMYITSERRLRTIIDGARVGTWEWNIQTGEAIFNERWAEMIGYTLDELAPLSRETWRRLSHAEDLQAAETLLTRHLDGELDGLDTYIRLRHKNGQWIWAHVSGRLVNRTDEGKPLLMSGTQVDVTSQKNISFELEASQARLNGLFDLSPVGIALIDHDTGAILQANDALVADTGYAHEELLKLRYRDLTPPGSKAEVIRHLESLGKTGLITAYETVHVRKDGSRYPVVINGMQVYEASGQKSIWLIIADITAQRALISQAELQRQHLHSVLDQLRLGTLLLDEAGEVRFVNDYCAQLGIDVAGATGRHWSAVLPLDSVQRASLGEQLTLEPRRRRRLTLSWNDDDRHVVEGEVMSAADISEGELIVLTDVTELHQLQQQLLGSRYGNLVGNSESMRQLFGTIGDVARGDWTVLIEGETGVGKELVADAIHKASPRCDGPFIAVNAAGLSETLLASQLFGHRKGSFTGAIADQQGLFEAADGGTLFLDEIGDLPLAMQASLLRVLQEKEIVRVGDTKARRVNVRILAATHKDLAAEVVAGRFRQDLLYRLRVARVRVPTLRERVSDVPLLVEDFLRQAAPVSAAAHPRCSNEALRLLVSYDWPGNVRELKAAIDHALIHARADTIEPRDLPAEIARPPSIPEDLPQTREIPPASERERILAALKQAGGNCSRAARLLGIGRATLYRRMSSLNVTPRAD